MNRSQPTKRKLPFSGLQRRVRARKEDPEPDFDEENSNISEPESGDEAGSADSEADDGASQSEDEDVSEEDEEDSDDAADSSLAVAQVSFGALAKAAASMPNIRRKKKPGNDSDDDDAESDAVSEAPSYEEEERHGKTKNAIPSRKNKHAPAEQSSKRAVSRKRQIIEVHKPQYRDPRFGPPLLGGHPGLSSGAGAAAAATAAAQREEAAQRNYAFLEKYRDSEMATLRAAIKKTKDATEKERLQRALMSMQSRRQARQRREAERDVIAEHRRQEKELVRQGKTPFYLKKSETKKRVLVDRFAGMKKKDVDKVITRRRKKEAAKERRELPMERRVR
ncbi:hypothetical protein BX600DRAFT_91907 [Xylariales sp. PMI_506]|nr:hypothetical protein BX600DRAFT_91907 [Xylariales sp. PMI_506]